MIKNIDYLKYLVLFGKVIDIEIIGNDELKRVTGGISTLGVIAVFALIIFISGVIEGFTNPGRCNN